MDECERIARWINNKAFHFVFSFYTNIPIHLDVLISREGIAKRLDLAEERPPTEEDYSDQLVIRFKICMRRYPSVHMRH